MRRVVALLLALLLAAAAAWAQDVQPVPALSARVIDATATLSAAQRQALDDKLAAFEKQAGSQIVILVVPTTAPGFRWTPVPTVSGATTSQTFYEDVRVPVANRIGPENEGWKLITNQLNRERVALCSAASVSHSLRLVQEWAQQTKLPDGRRVIDQEWVQLNLADVHAKAEFLKLINWKIAWGVDNGVSPADAS
ncbi:MAG: TPM domain-containing protein, partial [Burkholderiales bacterium]|nr:TPM domain-containing protein [Burkholderiales bacterium]